MDNLEKLLKDATPRPWMVPHLACDDVTCNCRYVVAEYGGMGSIATISVAESDKYPWGDDKGPDIESAKANARLIAMAPDLAAALIEAEKALGPFAEAADGRRSKGLRGVVGFGQRHLLRARTALAKIKEVTKGE